MMQCVMIVQDLLFEPKITSWIDALESPLERLRWLPDSWSEGAQAQHVYAIILKNYLLGRVDILESTLTKIVEFSQTPIPAACDWIALAKITQLRIANRKRADVSAFIQEVLDLPFENPYLNAEKNFVLAQSFEIAKKHSEAHKLFLAASKEFRSLQCFKKSCRSQLNAISSYSCENESMDMLAEYFSLAQHCEEAQEYITAAICYMNISREYQKIGELKVAYSYAEKSLQNAKKEKGGLNYALVVVHMADVLIDGARYDEARKAIAEIRIYKFPELQEAIRVLELKLNKSLVTHQTLSKDILPTWFERLKEVFSMASKRKDENLEAKLEYLLHEGSFDKFELIEKLWGNKEDFFVLENRIKNLLSRVRKRMGKKLVLENGKYSIQLQRKSTL